MAPRDNRESGIPHVEMRRVSKRDGPVTAGSDLSLTGWFTTLLGPTGCGKSTLLRMIAGLEETALGQCVINGLDVADTLRVNVAFQTADRRRQGEP
jgi:ABC-type Fe3+/spermidine/putrescine transport system ATPase subunit